MPSNWKLLSEKKKKKVTKREPEMITPRHDLPPSPHGPSPTSPLHTASDDQGFRREVPGKNSTTVT